MNDASIEYLKSAVEGLHNCAANFKEKTYITETYEGETVWDGNVYIFNIEGHSTAKLCYEWSSPITGTDQQRFYAVLHQDPVKSAQDAVRASIISDVKDERDI